IRSGVSWGADATPATENDKAQSFRAVSSALSDDEREAVVGGCAAAGDYDRKRPRAVATAGYSSRSINSVASRTPSLPPRDPRASPPAVRLRGSPSRPYLTSASGLRLQFLLVGIALQYAKTDFGSPTCQ